MARTLEQIYQTAANTPGGLNNPVLIKEYQSAGGTLSNSTIPTRTSEPVRPSPYFSSVDGQKLVEEARKKTDALLATPLGTPSTQTTQTGNNNQTNNGGTSAATPIPTPTAPPSKVKLINPATGQEVTFEDASINRENIQGFLNGGYSLSEASGAVPSWLTANGTTAPTKADTEKSDAQAALDLSKAELDRYKTQLANFNVSNDPALQAILSSTATAWDARVKEAEESNKSRTAAITQTGIRMGSRYTGGAGGVFGGIISAEERAGVSRIADLERQKQSALVEAQTAYETKKWDRYVKLTDLAQKAYDDQRDAIKELNKAQAEKDKEIRESKEKAETNYYNRVTKPIQDILADAAKNGAPTSVQTKISEATTLGGAIAAAGNYFQTATGDQAAYLFVKRQAESNGETAPTYEQFTSALEKKKLDAEIAKIKITEGIKFNYDLALAKAKASMENAPTLNYSGDFANTIKLTAQAGGTNAQRNQIRSDMESFIADGDYGSAYTQILSSASAKLTGANASNFQQQVQSYGALKDMRDALTEFRDAGGNTNIFKGGVDAIQTKIGALATDPKYAAIATRLNSAFQQYRQNMTGAAFGVAESAEYASVLPSAGNTFALNMAKIDGAEAYLNSVVNNTLKQTVGEGGVHIKDYAEAGASAGKSQKSLQDRMTSFRAADPKNEEMVQELHREFPNMTLDQIAEELNI